MRLEGSCHCGAVTFRLESAHPYPFNMLDFKASWVDTGHDPQDKLFGRYPEESIAAWHERLGLVR